MIDSMMGASSGSMPCNVLVAEDDEAIIGYIRDALVGVPLSLTIAVSLAELREVAESEQKFNLVCLDFNLRDGTTAEFSEKIARGEYESLCGSAIVFMGLPLSVAQAQLARYSQTERNVGRTRVNLVQTWNKRKIHTLIRNFVSGYEDSA